MPILRSNPRVNPCACLKMKAICCPWKKTFNSIAVIGPNANIARMGDYTEAAQESSGEGHV